MTKQGMPLLKKLIITAILVALATVGATLVNSREVNASNNVTDNSTAEDYIAWQGIETLISGRGAFPSFNILPNGHWITAYKVAPYLQGTGGAIYLQMSTDNGSTWNSLGALFNDGGEHDYNVCELIVMPNGNIWAIASKRPLGLVYKISSDNCTSWSEEQEFPDLVDGGFPRAAMTHFLRVGDTVYVPVMLKSDNSENVSGAGLKAGIYTTPDSGATWSYTFLDSDGWLGVGGAEIGIAYTGNSTLLAIWRAVDTWTATVWQSVSYDMGKTWASPLNIGVTANGTFPWLADVELVWVGDSLILTALTNTDNDNTQGLSAWFSTDNGSTWGDEYVLIEEAAGEIGYHGIESIGNREAYIVYENGPRNESAIYGRKIKLIDPSAPEPLAPEPPTPTPPAPTGGGSSGGGGGGGGGASAEYLGINYVLDITSSEGKFTQDCLALSGNKKVSLVINKGIYGLNSSGRRLVSIRIDQPYRVPSGSTNYSVVKCIYHFQPKRATFNPSILLTIHFDDSDIGGEIAHELLTVIVWDKERERWVEIDSTVNLANCSVMGYIDTFSYYALSEKRLVFPRWFISQFAYEYGIKVREARRLVELVQSDPSALESFTMRPQDRQALFWVASYYEE